MLISVHIPKTGGSSFHALLSNHFGSQFMADYGDRPLSVEENERQQTALSYDPYEAGVVKKYECIHGHFLATKYAALLENPDHNFIIWLRDPVQRAVSRYYHHTRYAPANGMDVLSMEEFCAQPRLHNTYAKFLWEFELSQFSFIGVTERYEESLRSFSHKFNIPLPSETIKRNLNPQRKLSQEYKIEKELYSYIRTANADDVELYEQAKIINNRLIEEASL